MPTISINRKTLIKAIAAEVKRQSFGFADMNITSIEGVLPSGEGFEIEGIRVEAVRPKPADFIQRTPPAGQGKLRLATVDGVAK